MKSNKIMEEPESVCLFTAGGRVEFDEFELEILKFNFLFKVQIEKKCNLLISY